MQTLTEPTIPEKITLTKKDKNSSNNSYRSSEESKIAENNIPSGKEIAAALSSRIHKGKKILDLCEADLLDTLEVEGITLREWGKHLSVDIPRDLDDISDLEKAATNIGRSLQEAERILALYELKSNAAANFYEEGFAKAYVDEMEGKSRVAAEKIRQTVLATNQDVDYSLATSQAAQVIVSYFKRIIKGLDSLHRGLENRIKLVQIRVKYLMR